MEIQDVYKQKMAARLKEWHAKINLLEAQAENAKADMKIKRANELHELPAKQPAASEKIQELKRVGGEAWEQVKETADKIRADFKPGAAGMLSKYK